MVKQIIKRIIVGVGVALVLSFIYSFGVFADTLGYGGTIIRGTLDNFNNQISISGTRRWYSSNYFLDDSNKPYIKIENLNVGGSGDYWVGLPIGMNENNSLSYQFCTNLPITEGTFGYLSPTYQSTQWVFSNSTMMIVARSESITKGSTSYALPCFQFTANYSGNSDRLDYLYFKLSRAPQNSDETIITEIQNIQFKTFTEETRNRLQNILNQTDGLTQGINGLNNNITDDTPPSSNDVNSVIENKTQDNATVSDLIMTVPNIIGIFGTTLSGECTTPYNFGNMYGHDIKLTCIRPQNYLGSTIWAIVDIIFTIAVFVPFSKWIINAWNKFTSLKEVSF